MNTALYFRPFVLHTRLEKSMLTVVFKVDTFANRNGSLAQIWQQLLANLLKYVLIMATKLWLFFNREKKEPHSD